MFRPNKKTRLGHWLEGEIDYHGDYVGPGWSAGEFQNSVVSTNPARDEFDQTAKEHDYAYAIGEDRADADIEFAKKNIGRGIKRTAAGLAVGAQGIGRHMYKGLFGWAKDVNAMDTDEELNPARYISSSSGFPDVEFATDSPNYITPQKAGPSHDSRITPDQGIKRTIDFGIDVNGRATHIPRTMPPSPPDSPIIQTTMTGAGIHMNSGDDIPVVPPPAKISKIIPDYTTIKLPWHAYQGFFFNNNITSNGLFIRLNSIQDPSVSFSWHRPKPYTTWNTLYKYYRVLACDVHIRYHFIKGHVPYGRIATGLPAENPNLENPVAKHIPSLICGYAPTDDQSDIYPNAVASIEGKHSKNMWLDPRDAEMIVDPSVPGGSYVYYFGGVRECDYHYTPESWDYHVRENVHDSRWTLMNSNPDESHLLHVYCMHPGIEGEGTLDMRRWVRIDVNVNYTVQLREHAIARQHETTLV